MSEQDNRDYYAMRAANERSVAAKCTDPLSAAIHRELAEGYEALLRPVKREPPLPIRP